MEINSTFCCAAGTLGAALATGATGGVDDVVAQAANERAAASARERRAEIIAP